MYMQKVSDHVSLHGRRRLTWAETFCYGSVSCMSMDNFIPRSVGCLTKRVLWIHMWWPCFGIFYHGNTSKPLFPRWRFVCYFCIYNMCMCIFTIAYLYKIHIELYKKVTKHCTIHTVVLLDISFSSEINPLRDKRILGLSWLKSSCELKP